SLEPTWLPAVTSAKRRETWPERRRTGIVLKDPSRPGSRAHTAVRLSPSQLGDCHATLELLRLWCCLPFAVRVDLRLHGRLRRQSARAGVHRCTIHVFGRLGHPDRSRVNRPLRLAALDHGPPWIQARVDTARPQTDRAKHLRAYLMRRDF